MAPTLRLAASHDGHRSRYWTFKPTTERVGLYISREGTPGAAHISLHSDQAWHLSVDRQYYQLPIAQTIESTGVRHAVCVLISKYACRVDMAAPRVELLEFAPRGDDKLCIAIDVFMLSKGGHVFGATENEVQPRWELPLPDGHAAHILARAQRAPRAATFTVEAPPDAIAHIQAGLAARTHDHLLVLGSDVGGAVTIVDADIRPAG